MTRKDARQLARSLMDRHGLEDWPLRFNRKKSSLGLTCFRPDGSGWIELSGPYVSLCTPEQLTDTILHEIAHALTGPAHDKRWARMCRRLGARPSAVGSFVFPTRWQIHCQCGKIFGSRKKPDLSRTSYVCTDCGRGGLSWKDMKNEMGTAAGKNQ